jgi:Amt family ammonium transporter
LLSLSLVGSLADALPLNSYQNMFAALVPAVLIGAAAERGRILPACIFFFCWSTVVYCPVAHWIWAPEGWAFQYGASHSLSSREFEPWVDRVGRTGILDYAGGGPIEICSGVTGLVYSIFLGKRRGFGTHILSFKVRTSRSSTLKGC